MAKPGDIRSALLAAIEQINASAFGEQGWEPALESISDLLGADCSDLSFIDPATGQLLRWDIARFSPEGARQYSAEYLGANFVETHPRVPRLLALSEGDYVADSDLWSAADQRRMQFFTQFYRKQNLHEGLWGFARKREDGQPWIVFATHFGKRRNVPQREIRQRIKLLLPHIRRAAAIESKLATAKWETAALEFMLDHVAEPAMLMASNGKVVRGNAAATRILTDARGVSLAADDRLLFSNSGSRDAFARALAQCCSPILLLENRGAEPAASIAVRAPDRPPVFLVLQPLPATLKGVFGAVAIVTITDPQAKPQDAQRWLRLGYNLSPAEARLVQALREGNSLKEFAATNELSYETVRTYLRRVFAKTGVHRQSDLIRIRGK